MTTVAFWLVAIHVVAGAVGAAIIDVRFRREYGAEYGHLAMWEVLRFLALGVATLIAAVTYPWADLPDGDWHD